MKGTTGLNLAKGPDTFDIHGKDGKEEVGMSLEAQENYSGTELLSGHVGCSKTSKGKVNSEAEGLDVSLRFIFLVCL